MVLSDFWYVYVFPKKFWGIFITKMAVSRSISGFRALPVSRDFQNHAYEIAPTLGYVFQKRVGRYLASLRGSSMQSGRIPLKNRSAIFRKLLKLKGIHESVPTAWESKYLFSYFDEKFQNKISARFRNCCRRNFASPQNSPQPHLRVKLIEQRWN